LRMLRRARSFSSQSLFCCSWWLPWHACFRPGVPRPSIPWARCVVN